MRPWAMNFTCHIPTTQNQREFFIDSSTVNSQIPEVLRGLAQASSFLFPPPCDYSSQL
jgi:hypothetical protein